MDDREVADAPPPPLHPMPVETLFPDGQDKKPDWRSLREHFRLQGRLTEDCALRLIQRASEILRKEPTLLNVQAPVTVVGDIHGQYYDMLKMFDIGGSPEATNYLFLGDYVDRGSFSCEVIMYLFALKISFPRTVRMIRGNHECRNLTSYFNFKQECLHKYSKTLYEACMESFDALPLAANIDGKFLCMHGGVSPRMRTLDDINSIDRFREPPTEGLMCDVLWADPLPETPENEGTSFIDNSVRGCSYFFGHEPVAEFLERNGLFSIIRAHEAEYEGYRLFKNCEATDFPSVVTIFSAPNYCDAYNNKGAILRFDKDLFNIRQFNFVEHPYHLPNFMDVFTWSLPFVAEKVTEMLVSLMTYADGDDEMETESSQSAIVQERGTVIRSKVQSVTKWLRMYKVLREENELIVQLKALTRDNRIPQGVLLQGKEGIIDALRRFEEARKLDQANERHPLTMRKAKTA